MQNYHFLFNALKGQKRNSTMLLVNTVASIYTYRKSDEASQGVAAWILMARAASRPHRTHTAHPAG